jgi:hypothetical protein
MFSQAEWTRSRDVTSQPPSNRSFLHSHSAKPSRVFHAPQALTQQQSLTSPSQMTPASIAHPLSLHSFQPHHNPTASSTTTPHAHRSIHYTLPSPPPPHPQRHHLDLELGRLLICSLSPAAQGRHSGSRDSEPLGLLILTFLCRPLELGAIRANSRAYTHNKAQPSTTHLFTSFAPSTVATLLRADTFTHRTRKQSTDSLGSGSTISFGVASVLPPCLRSSPRGQFLADTPSKDKNLSTRDGLEDVRHVSALVSTRRSRTSVHDLGILCPDH